MQVLDPVSAPKWRVDCNRCNFLVYLPPNLHSVKVSKTKQCEVRVDRQGKALSEEQSVFFTIYLPLHHN